MTTPTTSAPPASVVAKVKTAAQAFWTFVVQALAVFALDRFGVDLTDLSTELTVLLVAVSTPLVAAILMWLVDVISGPLPIVKRLWVFVTDPVYEAG